MARKVFITGLLVFFRKGSLAQLVCAMLTSLIYLVTSGWLQPCECLISRYSHIITLSTDIVH